MGTASESVQASKPIGKCRVCGRKLHSAKSIAAGVGPVCLARDAQFQMFSSANPLDCRHGNILTAGLVCQRDADGGLATNITQEIRHHSPTGFECGYAGSGPADLALNVLHRFLPPSCDGEEPISCRDGQKVSAAAWNLHQSFKSDFIEPMDRSGGTITAAEIEVWIAEHLAKQSIARRAAS